MPVADKVIVELEARLREYIRDLDRARNKAETESRGISGAFGRMAAQVSGHFKAMIAGYLGFKGAQMALGFVEANTRITNSLRVAGLEGENLTKVYDALYASAQKNSAPFESLAELYGKVSISARELNLTQDDMIKFADNVSLALRAGGKTAQESAGALLQLSQALGGGIVRAEEFTSIIEGAPTILHAVAAGLEEAGGSVGQLRKIMLDEKLTSEAFFRAFEAGSVILEQRVAGASQTAAQGMTGLENALIRAFGQVDNAVGISAAMNTALSTMGEAVTDIGNLFEENQEPIRGFFQAITDGVGGAAGALGNLLLQMEQTEDRARAVIRAVRNGSDNQGAMSDAGSGAGSFDDFLTKMNIQRDEFTGAASGAPPVPFATPARAPVTPVRTVSLADMAGAGANAAADAAKRAATNKATFDAAIQSIKDETEALADEQRALGMSEQAALSFLTSQELLKQARDLGIEQTTEVIASINAVSDAYAAQQMALDELATKQAEFEQFASTLQSVGESLLGGFIDDLREGKSATEALNNALGSLADMLIDMAVKQLVANAMGALLGGGPASGNDGLGAAIMGAFGLPGAARGVANSGGRRGEIRGFYHGQEAVIPLPDGGNVPVELRGGGSGAGAAPVVNIHDYNNNEFDIKNGSNPDEIEILVRGITRNEIASNRVNPIMQGKFGLPPRVRHRG